jgi:probable dihydroxyacetone kinase regulator
MSKSNITKRVIAAALKELMNDTPFNEISVNNIVERIGINRKTFYYHFKDKYDLVNWIFNSEVVPNLSSSFTLADWPEGSLRFCRYLQHDKAFYTNALNASGQNSFSEYLYDYIYKQIQRLCLEACDNRPINQADFDFIVDFLTRAFFGVLITWVKNGMHESPEIISRRLKFLVVKSTERLLANMSG